MTTATTTTRWTTLRFGLGWFLATLIGMMVPFILFWIIYEAIAGPVTDAAFPFALIGAFAIGGLGVGILQWLVVRRRYPGKAAAWIGTMLIGFTAVATIYVVLIEMGYPLYVTSIAVAVTGALVIGLLHVRFVGTPRPWIGVIGAWLFTQNAVDLGLKSILADAAMPLGLLVAAIVSAIGATWFLSGYVGAAEGPTQATPPAVV